MKIAIMIDSLAIGGAQKHVRQLACGLAGQGHVVTVWVLNEIVEPLYAGPLRQAGVDLAVVGRRNVASTIGLWSVAGRWSRENVDLVVVVLFVSTVFGRIAAQLAGGIPVVTSLQARNLDYTWWQRDLLKSTSGLNTWTISNSRLALRWAIEYEGVHPRRCSFLPNAVDAPTISNRLPSWGELGLPQLEGFRVIGSLGRLHWQKGYDVLLDAVASLAPSVRDRVRVVIWGEGPERRQLEEQAADLGVQHVFFFPGQRDSAAELIIPKFDLYVQPSRFEGMPNALIEAVAAGIPAIASAVDGVREMDWGDSRVQLVPADDPARLAMALETFSQTESSMAKGQRPNWMQPQPFPPASQLDLWKRIARRFAGESA